MPVPKVAIIGAGPAGCTLARILHQSGIESTVFEGEADPNARGQGGTLDLHEGSGLLALRRAGLLDEFKQKARYDGEAFVICNKHLRRYVSFGGATKDTSRGRPEIDRPVLRSLLADSLPTGTIRWNHKLREIDDSDRADIRLHFADGSILSGFDLVVGADGAWSKVRPLLTTMRPFFVGVTLITYTVTDVAKRHPALNKLVNRGSLFAFSDGKAILAQQMGDGTLSVGTVRQTSEDYLKTLPFDVQDLAASKKHALAEFEDWDSQLKKLIEVADDETKGIWSASLYMLPAGARWAHRPGVTLVGDAAHVMVPFAGEGVNASMLDSVQLADAIVAASKVGRGERVDVGVLSQHVKAYEEAMFIRTRKTSEKSFDMMNGMFFDTDAPDSTIEKYIVTAASDGVPVMLIPLLSAATKLYFKWFKWQYPGRGKIGAN